MQAFFITRVRDRLESSLLELITITGFLAGDLAGLELEAVFLILSL